MGFSKQEYWSGLPFPSSGDLPDPGMEPRSPALQADSLLSEPLVKPKVLVAQSCPSLCNPMDCSLMPTLSNSLPIIDAIVECRGEGNGNPLQYSGLENPICEGTWRDTVRGVARVIRLGD